MALGTFDRDRALQELGDHPFDVLVVGGGITGCGVALDAASRGLRTALVERDDFASGTSSKSSKMVHGGLRYLQNGDVRLVYEALRERQRLRRNAPHLVDVLPFLIPIFAKDGLINAKVARALGSAMWMYDLTGGARIGKLHKRLSKEEAVEQIEAWGGLVNIWNHVAAHLGLKVRVGLPEIGDVGIIQTVQGPVGGIFLPGQVIMRRAEMGVRVHHVPSSTVRRIDGVPTGIPLLIKVWQV